jgi:hypothetical protein
MSLSSFNTKYSLWAAILYAVTASVFLFNNAYANMWLLYVGNILFSGAVLWGVIRVNHRVNDSGSIQSLFMVGMKITLYALLIASVLCLLMMITKTTLFANGTQVTDSPTQAGSDTRGDMVINLFISAVFVNAILGSLASLIGSSVAKRNQKTTEGKTIS